MSSTSVELIDTMLSLMPDAAVVVDRTGVVTHTNDALSALFGHAPDDLVGQPIEVLVPERMRSLHRAHRAGFSRDPRPRAMGAGLALFGRRRDGTEFPIDISLAPLALDGDPSVVASIRDVSDRAEVEAWRAQLTAIVEGSGDAIFSLGVDGFVRSWNPGTERALGHGAEEVIGTHVTALFEDGTSVEFEDQLGAAAQGSTLGARDMVLVTRSGAPLPVTVVVSPLLTEGAGLTGFSVVRDITERRRAEAELEQAKAERDALLIGEERGRIARDLHDLVIQRLFATGLSLQSVMPLVHDERAASRLGDVVDELDTTIREIRTTIFTLSPPAVTTGGLRTEILDLVDESTRSLGFEPTTGFSGPVDSAVDPSQAANVLAVVREALANIARHAHASSARVEVRATRHDLELSIVDDGVGLTEGRREGGLRNLRHRAETLGGTLVVADANPSGVELVWRIPVGRPPQD